MAKISHDELRKLAALSQLSLSEQEIPSLVQQLQDILSYAERVQEVAGDAPESVLKMRNVFRDDVPVATDPQPILAQAPEQEDQFFVVPKVIDHNE